MNKFLQLFIAHLAAHNVAPPEIQSSDVDRSKSYLYDLPDRKDDPDDVFAFRIYHTRHAKSVAKNVGVVYIQVLVRAFSQKDAYDRIYKLYHFLLQQSDVAENDIVQYLDTTTWVIIDCQRGPIKVKIDEQGRHIWGLSFPVKTNLY
jgi:hypothetical protein